MSILFTTNLQDFSKVPKFTMNEIIINFIYTIVKLKKIIAYICNRKKWWM